MGERPLLAERRHLIQEHRFTPREIETAQYIAEGMTYDEIAARMGIATRTVITYATSLRVHLGVEKKRQIPRAARDAGLID